MGMGRVTDKVWLKVQSQSRGFNREERRNYISGCTPSQPLKVTCLLESCRGLHVTLSLVPKSSTTMSITDLDIKSASETMLKISKLTFKTPDFNLAVTSSPVIIFLHAVFHTFVRAELTRIH